MYLGPITTDQTTYRDVFHPSFGTLRTVAGVQRQTHERYQCDHCGRLYDVLGLATEPFYCADDNTLISMTKASARAPRYHVSYALSARDNGHCVSFTDQAQADTCAHELRAQGAHVQQWQS